MVVLVRRRHRLNRLHPLPVLSARHVPQQDHMYSQILHRDKCDAQAEPQALGRLVQLPCNERVGSELPTLGRRTAGLGREVLKINRCNVFVYMRTNSWEATSESFC